MTHRVIIPMAPPEEVGANWKGYRLKTVMVGGERVKVIPDLPYGTRQAWRAKAKAVKHLREVAYYAALAARPSESLTGRLAVEMRIGWGPNRKTQDASNCVFSCKGILDSLTKAGWWADDKYVQVNVVEQLTWGRLDAGTRALYPGGFVVVEVA